MLSTFGSHTASGTSVRRLGSTSRFASTAWNKIADREPRCLSDMGMWVVQ